MILAEMGLAPADDAFPVPDSVADRLNGTALPKIRLLVVEDDPLWIAVIRRSLQGFTSQLTTTHSLETAEHIMKTQVYDAALVDLQLTDAGPEETFKVFNAFTERLPVVVLTGSWLSLNRLREQRREIDDIIIKDGMDARLLKTVIGSAIRKWRLLQ